MSVVFSRLNGSTNINEIWQETIWVECIMHKVGYYRKVFFQKMFRPPRGQSIAHCEKYRNLR